MQINQRACLRYVVACVCVQIVDYVHVRAQMARQRAKALRVAKATRRQRQIEAAARSAELIRRKEREQIEQVAEAAFWTLLTGGVVGTVVKAAAAITTVGLGTAGAIALDVVQDGAKKEAAVKTNTTVEDTGGAFG